MKEKFKKILDYSLYDLYTSHLRNKRRKTRRQKNEKLARQYFTSNEVKKLQIGCGTNLLNGWLNSDLNDSENVFFLDAGGNFPFKDNSFEYIYSEHLFEHLTPEQQVNMLQEGRRVLKEGGVMRIATPSIDFLFDLYANPSDKENKEYIEWAMINIPGLNAVKKIIPDSSVHLYYVINNFFKAWGHQMIHNFSSLEKLALQNGYSKVTEEKVGESGKSHLKNIERHGTIIPKEINIKETMVAELIK